MKALVTGATGFIGSAITRQLLDSGADVRVLVRATSDSRNIDGLKVERAEGDICDAVSVRAARRLRHALPRCGVLHPLGQGSPALLRRECGRHSGDTGCRA